MIDFKDISLSFHSKMIFEHFNATIQTGEKVGIRGASGKGKTTLLKTVMGLCRPDSGEIQVNQLLLNENNIAEIRKTITWIPQNINLPAQNGMQLVEWLNLAPRVSSVNQYLNDLGLDHSFLNKSFLQVSGGQKQRIILAICLSMPKSILLIDEPTSSLDNDAIRLLINLLSTMKGKTILAASHHPIFLNHMDRIIEL